VKSSWRSARAKANLQHVNFHDLRHSCASIMLGLGVDLHTISEIPGHGKVSTTQRYAYLQLRPGAPHRASCRSWSSRRNYTSKLHRQKKSRQSKKSAWL
jgi:integrase